METKQEILNCECDNSDCKKQLNLFEVDYDN